jgi:hypothetical protein
MRHASKRILFILLVFSLAGCETLFGSHKWYDNRRALDSTLERPVTGTPETSTYVESAAKGREFKSVAILPVTVTSTRKDEPEERDLLAHLSRLAEDALRDRLTFSERFGTVLMPGEGAAETTLSTEMKIHVATIGGRVMADPILNDTSSKVFMVFTLRDTATGRVIVKFTSIAPSKWEYAPSVMKEMDMLVMTGIKDLGFVFSEM